MYVCSTEAGTVLELRMPELTALRRLPLFSLKEHLNSIAPLEPGILWGILHNLGAVRVGGSATDQDIEPLGRLWLKVVIECSGAEPELRLLSATFVNELRQNAPY